mmetsp:Transcript_149895/g.259630  ORF Transcript_149895/g.259630 Transcript_149895/m.259630 type:complete len:253 (+) Transcript_149895:3-761(+)
MPMPRKETVVGHGLLKPWVHFIPLEHDYSDLDAKMQWCLDNLDDCEDIAHRSSIFMYHLWPGNELFMRATQRALDTHFRRFTPLIDFCCNVSEPAEKAKPSSELAQIPKSTWASQSADKKRQPVQIITADDDEKPHAEVEELEVMLKVHKKKGWPTAHLEKELAEMRQARKAEFTPSEGFAAAAPHWRRQASMSKQVPDLQGFPGASFERMHSWGGSAMGAGVGIPADSFERIDSSGGSAKGAGAGMDFSGA